MTQATDPIRVGESELSCPRCWTGRLAIWRGTQRICRRPLSVEWLRCDQCGVRTASVIVRADGPYRAELVRLGRRLGGGGNGYHTGGA